MKLQKRSSETIFRKLKTISNCLYIESIIWEKSSAYDIRHEYLIKITKDKSLFSGCLIDCWPSLLQYSK